RVDELELLFHPLLLRFGLGLLARQRRRLADLLAQLVVLLPELLVRVGELLLGAVALRQRLVPLLELPLQDLLVCLCLSDLVLVAVGELRPHPGLGQLNLLRAHERALRLQGLSLPRHEEARDDRDRGRAPPPRREEPDDLPALRLPGDAPA